MARTRPNGRVRDRTVLLSRSNELVRHPGNQDLDRALEQEYGDEESEDGRRDLERVDFAPAGGPDRRRSYRHAGPFLLPRQNYTVETFTEFHKARGLETYFYRLPIVSAAAAS